jgi:hypothetical protein
MPAKVEQLPYRTGALWHAICDDHGDRQWESGLYAVRHNAVNARISHNISEHGGEDEPKPYWQR